MIRWLNGWLNARRASRMVKEEWRLDHGFLMVPGGYFSTESPVDFLAVYIPVSTLNPQKERRDREEVEKNETVERIVKRKTGRRAKRIIKE